MHDPDMARFRRAVAEQQARDDAANADTFARMRANRDAAGGIEAPQPERLRRSMETRGGPRRYDYGRVRRMYGAIGTYEGTARIIGCSAETVRRIVTRKPYG